MTPIAIKMAHSQPVAALAKKAAERIDKLMKAQTDAIFTYAWEPTGTKAAGHRPSSTSCCRPGKCSAVMGCPTSQSVPAGSAP